MPFTFSHPAIVLPFERIQHGSICMSALIIGSITPDFEYFVKMKLVGRFSHSLEGMFLFDLPLAFFLMIVFHQIVKKPLIVNLPSYFYARLYSIQNFNLINYIRQHYFLFLLFLLIGIASHILWDSFTHANSYFVDKLDVLSTPVTIDGFPEFPLFRYLQHLSTLFGGGYILFYFHRLPKVDQRNSPSIEFWIILFIVATISMVVRSLFGISNVGDFVTSIISSGIIGLIASSTISMIRSSMVKVN